MFCAIRGVHSRVDETMRIRFIMIIILVLMISIGCSEKKTEISSEEGSSDEWVEYGRSNDGGVFLYNKVRIKHTTKDIVQVWGKYVLSDESRKRRSNEGGKKLSHNLTLEEIDCKTKEVSVFISYSI
jgi:hypothetical protein